MSPRKLLPGEVGEPFTEQIGDSFQARVRFVREDGVRDRVSKRGATEDEAKRLVIAEARRRLKEKMVRETVDPESGKKTASRRSAKVTPSSTWREAGKNLRMDATISDVAEVYLLRMETRSRRLAAQSRNQKKRTVRKHVMGSDLGKLIMHRLTVGDISEWYDNGVDMGRASTTHQTLTELREIIDLACELGVRADNPARVYHAVRVTPEPGYIPTGAELQLLRKAIRQYVERPGRKGPKPQPYLRHTIDIVAGTSLRIGEIMSIEWDEVLLDSEPPLFKLTGNVVEGHGVPKQKVYEVKNRDGGRRVPLPNFVVDVLRERWAQAQLTERLTFVFETSTGRPVGMHQIRVQLWKVRDWIMETDQADLAFDKKLGAHAFRRLALDTLAEEKGLTTAARQGGQREASVTERFYAHNRRSVPDSRDTFDQFAPES